MMLPNVITKMSARPRFAESPAASSIITNDWDSFVLSAISTSPNASMPSLGRALVRPAESRHGGSTQWPRTQGSRAWRIDHDECTCLRVSTMAMAPLGNAFGTRDRARQKRRVHRNSNWPAIRAKMEGGSPGADVLVGKVQLSHGNMADAITKVTAFTFLHRVHM